MHPAVATAAGLQHPGLDAEKPGSLIGPYRLLEQIGEGGFGIVFLAEQERPVRRTVALKVIKPGMDTREVIARFEAERQALALMDHPNIARVMDAGSTERDRPYFVMELVRGVALTDYCDRHRLPLAGRLQLFVTVCNAVQHAHQKGIIHRDLKPSNVLVALDEGIPVAKVIDFGVAKAAGRQHADRATLTTFPQVVGTPLYMSPEQTHSSGGDVDTRSDFYSLGVILYELLTGTTPFGKDRLHRADAEEVRRIIRDEEPPRPSTRIDALGPERLAVRPAQVQSVRARRFGLDRDEGVGQGSQPPLRVGRRVRTRRRTLSAGRTRAGMSSDGLVSLSQVRPAKQAGPRRRDVAWVSFVDCRRGRGGQRGLGGARPFVAASGSEEQASRALDEAVAWQGQKQWLAALAAAKRAEELLSDIGGAMFERARELRRDFEMVLRLERITLDLQSLPGNPTLFDFFQPDSDYAQAFREFGIDVESLAPADAAARIGRRGIALELAVALDAWAEARRYAEFGRGDATSRTWRKLLAVALLADPDPWRVRVREALLKRDREVLENVAREVPLAEASPVTLGLLGRALSDHLSHEQAEALLRQAQQRHPSSFWLNFDLAMSLLRQGNGRTEDAIRFLSVAMALRPDCPAVYAHLGCLLFGLRRLDIQQHLSFGAESDQLLVHRRLLVDGRHGPVVIHVGLLRVGALEMSRRQKDPVIAVAAAAQLH
jgi:serine/threonine-protein kinase